jgi:hypothetical protein
MWAGGEWGTIGGWYGDLRGPTVDGGATQADADDLVVWLDHRALPDGRYRVGRCSEVSALAEVDYRRTGSVPYFRRIHRDRNPYVCPHCGHETRVDDYPSDVIHQWCRACERFADGCTRDDSRRTLMGHVPRAVSAALRAGE